MTKAIQFYCANNSNLAGYFQEHTGHVLCAWCFELKD